MDVLDFKREAEQTLDEVRYSLSEGWVSENTTRECAYLNLTTREGQHFCIRLSRDGFQVRFRVCSHYWESSRSAEIHEFL